MMSEQLIIYAVSQLEDAVYCPVCGRTIMGEELEDGSMLWVHDDVIHEDDDLEALENGIH